ncbi:MAG TPA: hypothetical protein VKX28_17650 [Xanthobacteraceae bacterium]|jgi:hypothetical protein|nr:hypothetical protein [Xanthobacteraceae bacterium]
MIDSNRWMDDMRLIAMTMCAGLAAGYLVLGTTAGHAAANVDDAQNSCQKAALCASQAYDEKNDPDNPGMGRKFNALKAQCLKWAEQCNREMRAPEPPSQYRR